MTVAHSQDRVIIAQLENKIQGNKRLSFSIKITGQHSGFQFHSGLRKSRAPIGAIERARARASRRLEFAIRSISLVDLFHFSVRLSVCRLLSVACLRPLPLPLPVLILLISYYNCKYTNKPKISQLTSPKMSACWTNWIDSMAYFCFVLFCLVCVCVYSLVSNYILFQNFEFASSFDRHLASVRTAPIRDTYTP